ncbi:MAG: type VI secretion system baseplate subunit TssE [Pseudomonadota bacterium]
MPLFERLAAATRAHTLRVYDRDALQAAITQSLDALISVRAPVSAMGKPAASRTVLDYGILEVEALSPARPEDRAVITREVREAVIAFEPRLAEPNVEAILDRENGQALRLGITGILTIGRQQEQFNFLSAPGLARSA